MEEQAAVYCCGAVVFSEVAADLRGVGSYSVLWCVRPWIEFTQEYPHIVILRHEEIALL